MFSRIEQLEDRRLLSGSAAVPVGPSAAVVAGLTDEQVARAGPVIDWNATLLKAIRNDSTAPTWASRAQGMVGVAVFDAVNAIRPRYDSYPVPGLSGRPEHGASPQAAAIAAADAVLNSLYPDQKGMFDAEYRATLGAVRDGRAKRDGIAWGRAVGDAVLAWRASDGSGASTGYAPAAVGGPAGVYELTPGVSSALTPQWGQVTPWAMPSTTAFLPPPPPALDSAQYAGDFNYTKAVGGIGSAVRTEDQTELAHFWADVPGRSVTPPGHWDEIAEHMALQQHLNLARSAHLFALLNVGLADAAIVCWDAKYTDNLWRPVTAIDDPRAAQINPATRSDPTWEPLWKTPNFPSYTSGHSTFGGAADVILGSIFGRDTPFTIGSDDMPGITRSFPSFTAAADEAGESRVLGGIHFEFDNRAGLNCGRALGAYVTDNLLRSRGRQ